jgi:hypothetical protein
MTPSTKKFAKLLFVPALVLSAVSIPCAASLGKGPSNFKNTNALPMQALTAGGAPARSTYSVRTSVLPSGTTVREYLGGDDVVFAVSWSGPFIPDLRDLLGDHFAALTAESARLPSAGRSQIIVSNPDVHIESAGHMRAYLGRAWVTSKLPAGVTPSDIQ